MKGLFKEGMTEIDSTIRSAGESMTMRELGFLPSIPIKTELRTSPNTSKYLASPSTKKLMYTKLPHSMQ